MPNRSAAATRKRARERKAQQTPEAIRARIVENHAKQKTVLDNPRCSRSWRTARTRASWMEFCSFRRPRRCKSERCRMTVTGPTRFNDDGRRMPASAMESGFHP